MRRTWWVAVLAAVCLAAVGQEARAEMNPLYRFEFEQLPPELQGEGRLVPGKPGHGQAICFGETSWMVVAPTDEFLTAEAAGVLTFEAWYYREDQDDQGFLFRQDGGFGLLNIPWDSTRLNVGVWTSEGYQSFDTEPCLRTGVWQHVGLVIDRLDVRLYVNGHLQLERTMPAQISAHLEKSFGGWMRYGFTCM